MMSSPTSNLTDHAGTRRRPFVVLCLIALQLLGVRGLDAATSLQNLVTLSPDQSLRNRKISGGDKQSFQIVLTAGQFATITVEEHGINLQATLFDPSATKLVSLGNSSGAHGPIYLYVLAATSGPFRLDVLSTEDWANAGSFDAGFSVSNGPPEEAQTRLKAQTYFVNARDLVAAAQYEKATEEYRNSLSLWQKLNDRHWEALTRFALASAYASLGKYKDVGESLNEALKVPNPQFETNDWRLKASILNDLGRNYTYLGKSEKAGDLLNLALDLYAAHEDRRGQASALSNLGIMHLSAGESYTALSCFEKALPFRQAENDHEGAIKVINNIGGAYDTIGEPYKALDYFTRGLRGWQEIDARKSLVDPTDLAKALNNVGIAYDKLGDSGSALDYYQQALNRFKPGDPNRAATLDNIGDLYADLGDGERARYYYDLALNFWNSVKQPDVNKKANLLIHIGQYYLAQDNLTQAFRSFREAYDLNPGALRRADALTYIGTVLTLQKSPQAAIASFKQALQIQVDLQNRRGEAITRQKQGEAYALSGQPLEASQELDRALNLWRLVQDRRGEAATLYQIAKVEFDQNKLGDALQHSDQAIKLVESLRTKVSSHQLRISYFSNQENFYELNIDLNMRLYEASGDKQYLAAALQASERSRGRALIDVLNESRTQITEGVNPDLLKLAREVQSRLTAKSQAQTKLLSQKFNEKDAAEMSRELAELVREDEDIKERIRRTSSRYSQLTEPAPIALAEIQQLLDNDTLLVEYATGERRSYVWVVGKDMIAGKPLPGRQEIEAIAQRFTKAFADRNGDDSSETALQRTERLKHSDAEYAVTGPLLSQMLLEQIDPLLGKKRLLIVADGALGVVPFAALPTVKKEPRNSSGNNNSSEPLLLADHEIVTLDSVSVLRVQRASFSHRPQASQTVAVLANAVFQDTDPRVKKPKNDRLASSIPAKTSTVTEPDANVAKPDSFSDLTRALRDINLNGISWLPYSRVEALAIKSVAPQKGTMLALDFEASRATLMSPKLSNYRVVHLATHGIVNLEHPELSGIILSLVDKNGNPQDGYIRLHEIYNLNLPADLVVLSACETGVGKQIRGEGLIALTRGFMYAGAKRVVASLWKVEDRATAQLMSEFYKEMFRNGLEPPAALRAAQLTMSKDKQWHAPYYWAGFVLQGDWQ